MADYDSSLPVVGSQAITNIVGVSGTAFSNIAGSVAITGGAVGVYVSGVPLAISGNLGVTFDAGDYLSVVQSGTQWFVAGSVYATGSVNITNVVTVTGSVFQSTSPWIVLGSINVNNTVSTTVGVRSNTAQDFNQASAIGAGGSSIHWFTSTGSFNFTKVEASASGKAKFATGTGSPSITLKFVNFNSTATPDIDLDLSDNTLSIGSNTSLAVVKTNRDNQAQDLYSTIIGYYS